MMVNKQKNLKQKYTSYDLEVTRFHTRFPDAEVLELPTMEDIFVLDLEDPFWNVGHLTHPNELWATDVPTQNGIQAFRRLRSCNEELRRIAREVRNVVLDSLRTEVKLNNLKGTAEMRKLLYLIRLQDRELIVSIYLKLPL